MLRGFAQVFAVVVIFAVIGSFFGVLLGGLTGNYPLWIAVAVLLGAGFGLTIGYGLLPES